jgi:hypothetical protein
VVFDLYFNYSTSARKNTALAEIFSPNKTLLIKTFLPVKFQIVYLSEVGQIQIEFKLDFDGAQAETLKSFGRGSIIHKTVFSKHWSM